MKRSLKISSISILAVLILLGIGSLLFINKTLDKTNIYSGVRIEHIDVGEISKDDAKFKLEKKLDSALESKEIEIVGNDYSKILKYKELGVKNDYDKAVKQAYKVGREGTALTKLKEIYDVKSNGKNIDIEIIKNSENIDQIVKSISEELYTEKKEATINYSGGNFIVTDDLVGRSVDKDLLEKSLYEAINHTQTVELPLIADKPKKTKELLSQVKEEIGTYSTKFKTNDQNRVFNIQRASNSIDDKLVMPGETFSFNSNTGPRSLKAGYKEATVIMNGEFVPGEGGGVCQVSSTLYNTLLNSNMSIVERHAHSKPISYVPPGKDATVAFDVLDLKFKNNYSAPVYIKSNVAGDTLMITMFGNKSAN